MDNDEVFWLLEMEIKEGQLDEFKELLVKMVEASKSKEPNIKNYEWFISDDNKICHVYERYVDSAAAMVHLISFYQTFSDRFIEVVDAKRIIVYGNANAKLKKTLSSYGAIFMPPIGGFVR